MFYKQFYYICIVKKTRSNFFITITNRMGEVLISYSIGKVKELRKRKKRKSIRSISLIISRIGVILKKKIIILHKFFIKLKYKYLIRTIFFNFLKTGIQIKNFIYIKNRTHGFFFRQKKLRRI